MIAQPKRPISIVKLSREQCAGLAAASRAARPNAEQRREFAALKRAWREARRCGATPN